MVVDTSALTAILLAKPDAERFANALGEAPTRLMSAVTCVELSFVIEGKKGEAGRAAGLNIGDCFSYALAATTGHPLLFKGDDFVHTDVRVALEAGC